MKPGVLGIAVIMLWAAISGSFSGANLLLGLALALIMAWLLRARMGPTTALRRIRPVMALAGLFVWELLASAVRVALLVLSPAMTVRPAIVAVPLTVKSDLEITLLANLITLTPGTLSIDVSDDNSVLYVHVLVLDDRQALIAGIASGFEKKIKAVFA